MVKKCLRQFNLFPSGEGISYMVKIDPAADSCWFLIALWHIFILYGLFLFASLISCFICFIYFFFCICLLWYLLIVFEYKGKFIQGIISIPLFFISFSLIRFSSYALFPVFLYSLFFFILSFSLFLLFLHYSFFSFIIPSSTFIGCTYIPPCR